MRSALFGLASVAMFAVVGGQASAQVVVPAGPAVYPAYPQAVYPAYPAPAVGVAGTVAVPGVAVTGVVAAPPRVVIAPTIGVGFGGFYPRPYYPYHHHYYHHYYRR
jgi:hypothetical protein